MCPQAARPRSSVVGALLARAAMRHGTLDVVSIRNNGFARFGITIQYTAHAPR
jgi:hypothetical protein